MVRNKDLNYHIGKRYDGMMGRCYRETDRSYKTYGGRGIKVCSEWIQNIENFKVWMLYQLVLLGITADEFVKNTKNYQLDRINNNGHYTPTNCRLVSPQENARNKGKPKRVIISAEGNEHKI
jgi:hypothetical protein